MKRKKSSLFTYIYYKHTIISFQPDRQTTGQKIYRIYANKSEKSSHTKKN